MPTVATSVLAFLLVVAVGLTFAGPATAEGGDARKGRALAKVCQGCHTFRAGRADKFGPTLHGLFGRRAASVPGYPYSDAMRAAGWVWDEATLDRFIANPKAAVPGTQMPFAGYADAADRADLIAYLKKATVRD